MTGDEALAAFVGIEQILVAIEGETVIYDPVQAHAVVEAAEGLRRSVTLVIEQVRRQRDKLVAKAGGRVDVGNAVLAIQPKWRNRFDHQRIADRVVRHATRTIDKETGEILDIDDPRDAAERAVALMRAVYLSESSEAKKGALKELLDFETWLGALAEHTKIGTETKVRPK